MSFCNRMLLRNTLLGLASLLACAALTPAWAEQRVALVIGNSAYTAVPQLPNTTNDARAMTKLLGDAGFEVTSALDQSQAEMRKAIGEFATKIQAKGPDTVAAVFYAGHGLQVDGENFLMPIDLDPKIEADLTIQAVRFNDLLNTLASVPSKMRIIMVDACRSNPFPQLKANMGRGLAVVDAKSGSTGSFLAYSTSPGTDAEDGTGNNSPYTTALLDAAREPGLSIEDAFKRVRVKVTQATDGRQIPWESSSLTSGFQFFANAPNASVAPSPAGVKRNAAEWRQALQGKRAEDAFALVVADDTVPAYEAYVALFTAEPYGPRVRGILERRREMLFWNETLLLNTGAAYQAFLARFPNSDLGPTARRLEERTRNRALPVAVAALPVTNASLAPTCSCSPVKPAPAQKASKQDRRAEPRPAPRGRPQIVEEEIVYEPRPRADVGIGIGVPIIGGGGYGGPSRGGYGGGPTRGPAGNGRY